MQAAIICLSQPDGRIGSLEFSQALAIAESMRASGHETFMISGTEADAGEIPCLRLASPGGMVSLFRLWRWQRKLRELRIIAVGAASIRLAGRIFGMCRKKGGRLAYLFLLEAPPETAALELDALCVCGSRAIADTVSQRDKTPRPSIAQPGIDSAEYAQGRLWTKGERFIFGMAESLMPESGALLVVRAMASLWQHELPDWEVRMFGSGPRFDEVITEAEKMGVLSRLAIFGDQPLQYVAGQCHAWLAPGLAQNELPQTLWAGFAAGLPVVCSDSPLHEERLFGQNAALGVGGENPQDIARAMLALMQSGAEAKSLIRAGAALKPLISLSGMARRVCDDLAWSGDQPAR